MTVGRLAEVYVDYLRDERCCKDSRIETFQHRIKRWPPSEVPLRELTAKRLQGMYRRRVKEARSVATQHSELREVKGLFRWAKRRGYMRSNIAEDIEPIGKAKRGKKQLHAGEGQRLMARCLEIADERAIAVAAVMAARGRSAEVRRLRGTDVDRYWSGDGWRYRMQITESKTDAGERWSVPLHPALGALLWDRAAVVGDGYVFPAKRKRAKGKGYASRQWLLGAVRRMCEAAGLERITAHGARGTAITMALLAGEDLRDVSRSAGHTSTTVTERHYLAPGAIEATGSALAQGALIPMVTRGAGKNYQSDSDEFIN